MLFGYYALMDEIRDTSEIIDALGGNIAVAELTGATAKAVSNWRGFETLPSNTFVILSAALVRIGKTAPPSLWGMREGKGAA